MKLHRIIYTSIFFFWTFFTYSQDFAPVGSIWHFTNYETSAPYPLGYLKIECIGDTVLLGKTCRHLKKTKVQSNGVSVSEKDEFIYNSGDTVYVYVPDDNFYILYNFNAQPGDTWTTSAFDMYNDIYAESTHLVDSIATTLINGQLLKQLFVRTTEGYLTFLGEYGANQDLAIISEKIGDSEYMFPQNYGLWDIDLRIGLRCYSDSEFGEYNSGIVEDCEMLVSDTKEILEDYKIEIYPNPANDEVQVTWSTSIPDIDTILRITNLQGKVLKFLLLTTTRGNDIISLTDIPAGSYYVSIGNTDNNLMQKLIIIK